MSSITWSCAPQRMSGLPRKARQRGRLSRELAAAARHVEASLNTRRAFPVRNRRPASPSAGPRIREALATSGKLSRLPGKRSASSEKPRRRPGRQRAQPQDSRYDAVLPRSRRPSLRAANASIERIAYHRIPCRNVASSPRSVHDVATFLATNLAAHRRDATCALSSSLSCCSSRHAARAQRRCAPHPFRRRRRWTRRRHGQKVLRWRRPSART
jgi:hypothetical protein